MICGSRASRHGKCIAALHWHDAYVKSGGAVEAVDSWGQVRTAVCCLLSDLRMHTC
jgi:hypothetical protein